MKIIHIIDTLNWGGAQKLLLTFVENSVDNEITLISFRDNTNPKSIKNLYLNNGFNIEIIYAKKLLNLKRIFTLIKKIKTIKPDVIHTHLSYANIIGSLCGFICRIPVVSTLHNSSYDPKKTSKPVIFIETIVLRFLTSQIVAVGFSVEKAHQSRVRKKIVVIPNAVNPILPIEESERIQLKEKILGPGDFKVITAVGRLSPQKAYIDLLNALAGISKEYPETRLLVVGEGKERRSLEGVISDLKLEGKAFLLGERNDVSQLLQITDIFINSSHWEGLPVSILEAMSAGLPIVATNVGDIPRVIDGEVGLLVEPKSDFLKAALLKYLNQPELMEEHGKNAQVHFERNFHASSWYQKIIQVYRKAIDAY